MEEKKEFAKDQVLALVEELVCHLDDLKELNALEEDQADLKQAVDQFFGDNIDSYID